MNSEWIDDLIIDALQTGFVRPGEKTRILRALIERHAPKLVRCDICELLRVDESSEHVGANIAGPDLFDK